MRCHLVRDSRKVNRRQVIQPSFGHDSPSPKLSKRPEFWRPTRERNPARAVAGDSRSTIDPLVRRRGSRFWRRTFFEVKENALRRFSTLPRCINRGDRKNAIDYQRYRSEAIRSDSIRSLYVVGLMKAGDQPSTQLKCQNPKRACVSSPSERLLAEQKWPRSNKEEKRFGWFGYSSVDTR